MGIEDNKRKVKSFSLNIDKDKDIIEKLDEFHNYTPYLKDLIREDINKSNQKFANENLILEEILELKKLIKNELIPAIISKDDINKIINENKNISDVAIDSYKEEYDSDAVDALSQFD